MGTAKSVPAPEFLPPELGHHLPELLGEDPAFGLWKVAAIDFAYARSARMPLLWEVSQAKVPAELLPIASNQSLELLDTSLTKGVSVLVEYWLRACAASGKRVHPRQLPALMSWAVSHKNHWQQTFLPVLGERGVWLAEQHQRWRTILPQPIPSDLAQANSKEILTFLQALRAKDPLAANQHISAMWEEQPVSQKVAMLDTLEEGLEIQDESLLLLALNDKNKRVQSAAIRLLHSLPGSSHVRLASEALESIFELDSGRLLGMIPQKNLHIRFKPDPELLDTLRLETLSSTQGKSDQQHIIEQLITLANPRKWLGKVSGDPSQPMNLLREKGMKPFLPAIEQAVLKWKLSEEAQWLLRHWPDASPALLALLPENPKRFSLAIPHIRLHPSETIAALVASSQQHIWPAAFVSELGQTLLQHPHMVQHDMTSRMIWFLPDELLYWIDSQQSDSYSSNRLRDELTSLLSLRDRIFQSFRP